MSNLSPSSIKKLQTCHRSIQRVILRVSVEENIQVVEGHRTLESQIKAIKSGHSKLKNPENSKHRKIPSEAVDIAPLVNGKIDWDDIEGFKRLGELVLKIAAEENVKLSWGGHWKTFKDYPHFEL